MFDYAALPPEVNSARMYAGAGSAPMMGAAAAWDSLAAMLTSTGGSYRSVISELTGGSWQGGAAAAMAAAVEPFMTWMNTTAAQASLTANQARAAAAAYEAAFAAIVPPPVIAANRAQLTTLVNGNTLGQNTAAIAANQADYGEMWAQDATVMQTYAAGSAAAVPAANTLTPAPQTTSATAAPAAASITSGLQNWLDGPNFITEFLSSDPITALDVLFGGFNTIYAAVVNYFPIITAEAVLSASAFAVIPAISGIQAFLGASGMMPVLSASISSEHAQHFTLAGAHAPALGSGEVSAGMGRAATVGGVSAPPSWKTLASATSLAGSPGIGTAGPGWVGGIPPVGGMVNASRTGTPALRSDSTASVIPRLAMEGGGREKVRQQSAQASSNAEDAASGLSEDELRELEELRQAVAESAERRDAAARSIREAIR